MYNFQIIVRQQCTISVRKLTDRRKHAGNPQRNLYIGNALQATCPDAGRHAQTPGKNLRESPPPRDTLGHIAHTCRLARRVCCALCKLLGGMRATICAVSHQQFSHWPLIGPFTAHSLLSSFARCRKISNCFPEAAKQLNLKQGMCDEHPCAFF